MLDDINLKILEILQNDGRISNADIARQVGLTPSATLERIRKLESEGFIEGYAARLNPKALGFGMMVFIFVSTDEPTGSWASAEYFRQLPEVQGVYAITGEDCYLLKVRVKDTDALRILLRDGIGVIDGITSTRTVVVLGSIEDSLKLPLKLYDVGDE
jgi:Lrp/AsnC family leucine-responsive transcriptional regulator